MSTLRDEIAAFENMRGDLETEHLGKWAVIYKRQLIGVFEGFEEAAAVAVTRFGRGPYLIRKIGEPPVTFPASVLYRPVHAR